MDLSKHRKLWEENERYFLLPGEVNHHLIVSREEDGRMYSLIIEDDDVYEALIQKMIAEGIKILTPEDVKRLFNQPDMFEGLDKVEIARLKQQLFEHIDENNN